jgi:hypothetical protein
MFTWANNMFIAAGILVALYSIWNQPAAEPAQLEIHDIIKDHESGRIQEESLRNIMKAIEAEK